VLFSLFQINVYFLSRNIKSSPCFVISEYSNSSFQKRILIRQLIFWQSVSVIPYTRKLTSVKNIYGGLSYSLSQNGLRFHWY